MSKYKQTYIPVVDDTQFKEMKLSELKEYVKTYFNENLRSKTATNFHKQITVQFSRKGLDHLLYARNAGYIKLKAVVVLKEMIENAVYLNFKNKDSDDVADIIGYFNFKCKVNVESNVQIFRIVIRLTKTGKFYYDHAVRVRK